jgi:Homeodomain-like domain
MANGARVQAVAFQMQCDPSTVWRLCWRYEEAGLEGVLVEVPRMGHPIEISPLQRAQIVQLACLEPIAKGGCTLPTGPVKTWPAKRWLRALYRRLARAPCAVFCTRWTCSHIAHAIGKQHTGIGNSNSAPKKSSGATLILNVWRTAALGSTLSFVSMRAAQSAGT